MAEKLVSKSTDFRDFCNHMTVFAESQLDFHRQNYYGLSQQVYKRIMKCYEEPRMTNEETDTCAAVHRDYMQKIQKELTQSLMQKSQELEACTDFCKNEKDMPCINSCGTKYLQGLHKEFDSRLLNYIQEYNKIV